MPQTPSSAHTVSPQTYQYFVQEATELLQTLETELQTLRTDFSLQKVHTLMRAAHTLKGASASVGLDTIQKATHSLEDVFKALCYDDTVVSQEMERLIFKGYECLQLLMSAELAGAEVDGDDILNRMAAVVGKLQTLLGDRFGQEGHLPSSAELGFDMTQSIFQLGVAQRIATLEQALKNPQPATVRDLLKTQAEVFMGLGESLGLPGWEAIAQMTYQALENYPDLVLHIAPVALENFKAAQADVLDGDRTQGGFPSVALQQFCRTPGKKPESESASQQTQQPTELGHTASEADAVKPSAAKADSSAQQKTATEKTTASPSEQLSSEQGHSEQKEGWLKRRWKRLTQPIGTLEQDTSKVASQSNAQVGETLAQENGSSTTYGRDRLTAARSQTTEQTSKAQDYASDPFSDSGDLADDTTRTPFELADLTPTELDELNILPQRPAQESARSSENLPSEVSKQQNNQTQNNQLQNRRSQSNQQQSASTTANATANATIRMSLEHLNSLSQAMGELLTQQNRQTLYNEQLTTLVKKLLNRIAKQQQQLSQQQTEQLIRRPSLPSDLLTRQLSISPVGSASSDISLSDTSLHPDAFYSRFDSIELERYDEVQLLLQSCLEENVQQSESAEAIELFVKRSEQTLEKQKRLLANTRETLLAARMVPLETVFQQFPSTVERLKTQHQKPVELDLEGGDILVDRTIADSLYEPLVHLVRNAFDHGIEAPDERLAQSKPFTGTITVKGVQQGRHLLVSVADDGQGLSLEHIRETAIALHLITPAAAADLSLQQTIDLLFEPGFSTASSNSELSGRGVGLDAVRARVRSLKGWVTVDHDPSAGTCFTLQIPTSLSIARLLLCQSQGRTYALIADAVEHILMPTQQQIRTWKGGKMLTWQTSEAEHLVPVNALDEVLQYASPMSAHQPPPAQSAVPQHPKRNHQKNKQTANPVILLQHQNTLVGLEVEQLLGEQELVISPLGSTIVPPDYLYGSSILPDGQLTLVLDGLAMAKIIISQRQHYLEAGTTQKRRPPAKAANQPIFVKPLILTIDDSITVRNTLSEALQKANYRVIQARDGAEALQLLERHPDVHVILCDIEMPGMNGFEFLKVRQQQPELATIPTIMLTSRMGSKHRLLTEELGASGYITKPYLTPKLLQAITEAIEGKAEIQISNKQISDNQLNGHQPSSQLNGISRGS